MRKIFLVFSMGMLIVVSGCGKEEKQPADAAKEATAVASTAEESVEMPAETPAELKKGSSMRLSSPEFANGGRIPKQYTADGIDYSPALFIKDAPKDVESFALIMDDPDAPNGAWVHWVLWNIPSDIEEIPGGGVRREGIMGGTNSWGNIGYGGPAPPSGIHRYIFKLYALDTMLDIEPGADKETLMAAMEGHILDKTELMGIYSRD